MERKQVGRSNVTISGIGLGCVTFGREISEEDSFSVMDYALEKGITFFDTAEAYGGGQARQARRQSLGVEDAREVSGEMSSSERIIGDWVKSRGCRDQITICTKVSTGGKAENIRRALNECLERLQTDYVEIYKMHSPDADTPIEETLSALTDEVNAGKIQAIGCSNYSAAQISEALSVSKQHGLARFDITQPPYNLVRREIEDELLPLCGKEQIAVTPYSPLGAGFLTGKYTPDRASVPSGTRFDIAPGHVDIYFQERNFQIVEKLREKAKDLDVPMVRLAMAWAMTHSNVTSVIVGARTPSHIDNALEAYEMSLDERLRAEMNSW